MSTTTHTPGPWHFNATTGAVLSTAGAVCALSFDGAESLEQEAANARLIAAAPELLRCAVMALEELQEAARVNPLAPVAFRALRAAIAAATSASDTTTTEHPGA